MRRVILILGAVLLVFVGASVAVAQTEDGAGTPFGWLGGVISDALAGLVSDGTITQDQANAVSDAIETAREDRLAEREQFDGGNGPLGADHEAFEQAWADGVLTEDEAASLGDVGPMADLLDPEGPLAEYWADGQLTTEELQQARDAGVLGFGGPGGHHHDDDFLGQPDGDFSGRSDGDFSGQPGGDLSGQSDGALSGNSDDTVILETPQGQA